jgi:hypothetical protein
MFKVRVITCLDKCQEQTHAPQQTALLFDDLVGARRVTLAVLRLKTNSKRDDCTTGRSAGFSPLSMRPA